MATETPGSDTRPKQQAEVSAILQTTKHSNKKAKGLIVYSEPVNQMKGRKYFGINQT